MNTKEAAKTVRELKLFGQTINEAATALKNVIQVTKSIKRLAGSPSGSNLSSKLITAGMACIAFPDPTISDVIGTALVATGVALKKKSGPTIIDIFKENRKIMASIKKIYQEL
ncbi:MAG: hypothetical protein QXD53_06010 [Candidatus Bathyarchaeia archaeon]